MTIRPASSARDLKGSGALFTPEPSADGVRISAAVAHVLSRRDGVDLSAMLTAPHADSGAFVVAWSVDRGTLTAVASADVVTSSNHVWDERASGYFHGMVGWDRLCSSDFPAEQALRHGNCGTGERLFLGGEKVGSGRAWARIATGPRAGEAWELPPLGKMPFANIVASPHGKERTVIALFSDRSVDSLPAAGHCSELFIYIGTKQNAGSEIERAGLTNGRLFGVRVSRGGTLVAGESTEFGLGNADTGYIGNGRFDLVPLGADGDVSRLSAEQLEQDAVANNVFRMLRPGDGAWDARRNGNDALYFVTTDEIDSPRNSRLWRLQFDDAEHPEQGGEIEILLTSAPERQVDSVMVDKLGRILVQENTCGKPRVSKVRVYDIDRRELLEGTCHGPDLFEPGVSLSRFLTEDEEPEGMIDAQHVFGQGWFLIDPQNFDDKPESHPAGQLLAMHVRHWTCQ